MCLPLLRSDAWKPPNRLAAVLRLARQMLSEPNPDDAVEASIADQFKNQRREFDKVAKEWVKKYASTKL
jgi:ubiquitin-protein ligase